MSRCAAVLLGGVLTWGPLLADALDDPMRPPGLPAADPAREVVAPGYRLSSVFIGADRRVAVVNGRPVSVGDRVGAAVVADIQPSAVTLQRDGRRFAVSLVSLDVKQTAKKPQ